MILLILCIILNALIGVVFKLFEKFNINNFQAIVINYLVCFCTATLLVGGIPIPSDVFSTEWVWFAIALGFVFILVFNITALTVQHFGIVIASIFQKMSLIAPALIAILIYNESASWIKWMGIATSMIAIILLSYKKNKAQGITIKFWILILPLTTFLFSCLIDSALFLIEKNGLASNGDIGFISTIFLTAGLTGFSILGIQLYRKKTVIHLRNIYGGIALGIPNFFSIYLLLLVLSNGWGGSVVFPINNVGILLMAAVFGILFFNEKLTQIKLAGFILAIFSIIIIAIA